MDKEEADTQLNRQNLKERHNTMHQRKKEFPIKIEVDKSCDKKICSRSLKKGLWNLYLTLSYFRFESSQAFNS